MKNNIAITVSLISVVLALAVVGIGVFTYFFGGDTYPDFLTMPQWESCDGDIPCTESISFWEDGGFAYSCACGSPVEDYDLYDSYKYNDKNNIITLKGLGEENRKIKVLYHDETTLFLELPDGAFKYFINEKAITVGEIYDFVIEYFDNAQLYTVIKEEKDGVLTLLPQHYSGDEKERFEGLEYRAPLAKDAKAYTLYARIENGEESFEYNEIPFEGAFENVDNSFTCAYVDFNEKGEITTVIIYGATEIWG